MEPSGFSLWDRLLREVSKSTIDDWVVKLAALVIVGLVAAGLKKGWSRIWPSITLLWSSWWRLQRARKAISPESKGIWLAPSIPVAPPPDYENSFRTSIPIIVVANLKGGVGKTTTAANLLAHYAIKKKERVLALDLDFQGSLTRTTLESDLYDQLLLDQASGLPCKAAALVNDRDAEWLKSVAEGVSGVPGAYLVPSYYSLSAMENRVMVEWLIAERRDDVRYQLARILHHERIQKSFDRVIIDAPPRLTTACVQALCASTHVLIPTLLDQLSAEAVGAFCNQLRVNQEIWPYLRVLGALGTMTDNSTVKDGELAEPSLKPYEADAYVFARDAMQEALRTARPPLDKGGFLPQECFIPSKAELGKTAGLGIAYASTGTAGPIKEIREAFDRLGDEIDRRAPPLRKTNQVTAP